MQIFDNHTYQTEKDKFINQDILKSNTGKGDALKNLRSYFFDLLNDRKRIVIMQAPTMLYDDRYICSKTIGFNFKLIENDSITLLENPKKVATALVDELLENPQFSMSNLIFLYKLDILKKYDIGKDDFGGDCSIIVYKFTLRITTVEEEQY